MISQPADQAGAHSRCAPDTPTGQAAILAEKYADLGAPVPSSLLNQILHTDCAKAVTR